MGTLLVAVEETDCKVTLHTLETEIVAEVLAVETWDLQVLDHFLCKESALPHPADTFPAAH